MTTVWFVILAVLLVGYAILDGFDLGVGALHLFVARTNQERRIALAAIGPVWDGNEVWLLAWGGALFLAFPRAYAVGFSGFYLPLMIVLWLLMGRGIAIEFRHHVMDPLWQSAWDVIFSVSSLLLAVLYGVAVGNVVTGVPLNEQGYFQGLFEWMLNPYALLMGVFSLVVLSMHGANYLTTKTGGKLQLRARGQAIVLWYAATSLAVLLTGLTFLVRPAMLVNYGNNPVLLILPLLGVVSLVLVRRYQQAKRDGHSFLASSGVIITLLASTAIGLYPNLLPASTDPARSITIANAAASDLSLSAALIWIVFGIGLLIIYNVVMYRTFRGKVVFDQDGHY